MIRLQKWFSVGICLVSLASPILLASPIQADDGIVTKQGPAATETKRFDLLVREDIFAGFQGDENALQRGETTCEEALKTNPKNAEALVWRGAIRVYKAGMLFGKDKPLEAFPLWMSGQKDMDEAVKLEPDNVGVRIPRASVLLPSARNAPPAMAGPLLKTVLGDFEYIYKKQEKHLDDLDSHSRGELRMGLADTYRLLGKLDQSREQLEAIAKELPNTEYATTAKDWMAAAPTAKLAHNCIGCHSK